MQSINDTLTHEHWTSTRSPIRIFNLHSLSLCSHIIPDHAPTLLLLLGFPQRICYFTNTFHGKTPHMTHDKHFLSHIAILEKEKNDIFTAVAVCQIECFFLWIFSYEIGQKNAHCMANIACWAIGRKASIKLIWLFIVIMLYLNDIYSFVLYSWTEIGKKTTIRSSYLTYIWTICSFGMIRHQQLFGHAIFTPFWYHWEFYSFIPLIRNPGRFQWEFESTKLLWGECVGINLPETSIFNFIEYALSISISHLV